MPELTTNFAVSTVATPPSPSTSGTSVVVAASEGSRFPAAPFNATIAPDGVQATPANAEVVRVTARSTDTLTITRAQESSSARAVVAGDRIWAGVTVKTLTDLESISSSALLAAATSVAATSITLTRAAPVASGFGFVAIDPFTTNCELRKVVTVSGTALSGMTALDNAHSAGAKVLFFQGGSVPALWFGAKGDNSTNDEPALQWGLRQVAGVGGIWLEGENRTYRCSLPIVVPGSGKMRQLNLSANAGIGDPNGAFVMGSQGQIRTFTGDATTDLITITDGVHGMGSGAPFTSHHGIPVVFKGSSVPGGITAGKVYYGYATSTTVMRIASTRAAGQGTATSGSNVITSVLTNTVQGFTDGMLVSSQGDSIIPQGTTIVSHTSNTITMSANATASGGVTLYAGDQVNITSNGSGTFYAEVMSMARVYIDDVFIQGNSVTNLNGFAGALQQPGFCRKLRIDNCPGTGLTASGQQYIWENLEIIGCGTGIALEDMSMAWFYGTNVEGPTDRAVHFRAKAQIFQGVGNGMAHFDGWHDELNTVSNSVAFDLEHGIALMVLDGHTSMSQATQKFVHAGPAYEGTYTLDNCFFSSASPGAPVLIHDEFRGHNILAWDAASPGPPNHRRHVVRWDAGLFLGDAYPDRHPVRMLRKGGGYLGWGGQGDGVESFASRPGSAQTAEQMLWMDASGNTRLGITPTGAVHFTEQTDPAAPAANTVLLYSKDVGGKTALFARFPTGAVQQVAIEP